MIKLFACMGDPQELDLPDMTSLDAVSSQLPGGLYTTFRTYSGKTRVLDLRHHLDRLYAFNDVVTPSIPEYSLREQLKSLLMNFDWSEARVRLSISTGTDRGRVYLALEPLKLLNESVYQNGVICKLSTLKRLTPRLKTTSFITSSNLERMAIHESGVFEGLMVQNECITEGLTSNFYAVKDQKIMTASRGILLGVTRRAVLGIARKLGWEIIYKPIPIDQLSLIGEAFISSSSRGVVPVIRINSISVGTGAVGDIAKQLKYAYDVFVQKKAEEI